MGNKSWMRKIRPCLPLIGLYVGCVLIRFLLAMVTSAYPTVGIDEFLYYSLGRSIVSEGKLLYRGQPALYNYIVYPLALTPLYLLLPPGANFYRLIQLWNFMLMSLSVFPVYKLCLDALESRKKAFFLTAAVMLLPDFILGEYIFSEAVIYPLFYAAMYCAYRHFKYPRLKYSVWIGVLGAVLYFTKPGAVTFCAAALIWFLIRGIRRKSGPEIKNALAGAGSLGVAFAILWILTRYVLGYDGTLLAVYDEQLYPDTGHSSFFFFTSLATYPYYFILACGLIPALMPILRFPSWDRRNKQFYLVTVLALLAMMVGTAWLINATERQYTLFIRYIAMYLPLMLFFSCLPARKSEFAPRPLSWRQVMGLVILCGYVVTCTAVWGCDIGNGDLFENHFLMAMSISFADNIQGIGNVLIYLACGFALYLLIRFSDRKKLALAACAAYVAMTGLNNIASYSDVERNAYQSLADEAKATQDMIGGDNYIYVYTDDHHVLDYGLDAYSKHNVSQVALYDLFNNITSTGGVYTPFVPDSERGMRAVLKTPDVTTMVLERTVYPLVIFHDGVDVTYSVNEKFCIARFEQGTQLVDAIISNVESLSLGVNRPGILVILRDEWRSQPIKIRMEIESSQDQEMQFYSEDKNITIPLQAGLYWYEFTVNQPDFGYNFVVTSSAIKVMGFEIATVE